MVNGCISRRRAGRRTVAATTLALAAPAVAEIRIDPAFGTGAVVQRGATIVVMGSAEPAERVAVRIGTASRTVTADSAGRWRAELPSLPAGGEYRLTATGRSGTATSDDVAIGDVWLCSGQSNMAFPVRRALNSPAEIGSAADPLLRMLNVPQAYGPAPQSSIGEAGWRAADADSVGDFSAACYFMARDLRAKLKVPIGAINASWGGTRIMPWLPMATAATLPGTAEDLALLALYARDRGAAYTSFGQRWEAWWRGATRQRDGEGPWSSPDQLQWQAVPRPGPWDEWGNAQLKPYVGMLWFRRSVVLTPEQAAAGGTIRLGIIEDMDVVWINGVVVGTGYGRTAKRSYPIAPGLLRAGKNELIVNVLNTAGIGGFQGDGGDMRLTLGDGTTLPLTNGWRYALQPLVNTELPLRTPWESHSGIGTIYNGMVAPLGAMRLTGVAWYQGESDTRVPGYQSRLSALMAGWRRQFAAPDLPFLIVSLTGFGTLAAEPRESGRANVREAQRRAVVSDHHSALVVAIDLGEERDIHPANKQDVGHRLARAASAIAYAERVTPSGPRVLDAVRGDRSVVVGFKDVIEKLSVRGGAKPLGFELCRDAVGSCRWADATLEGDVVRLSDSTSSATRVRYAWGDNPIVNLYDTDDMPVGPFEIPIHRKVQ